MDILLLKDWPLPKHNKIFKKGSKLLVLDELGKVLIEDGIAKEVKPKKETLVEKLFPGRLKENKDPEDEATDESTPKRRTKT